VATRQDASTGEIVEDTEAAPAPKDGEGMHVKVYAPYKVYYEGQATSISAVNQTGPFDILPKHHHFITLLTPCDVVVRTATHEETIRIQGGIMHVKSDSVIVFLDV
jgi:F0F1-type ATP synthase epsilon subunit